MLRAWKKNRWSHGNPCFLTFSWRIQLAGGTVILVCVSSLWHLLVSFLHIVMSGSFFPPCVINAANTEASSLQASISPADLHGMWYPTVRRTLVCLSKLYRCIDVSLADFTHISHLFVDFLSSIHVLILLVFFQRAVFQGLSQEALSACIQSLLKASDVILKNKVWPTFLIIAFFKKNVFIILAQFQRHL